MHSSGMRYKEGGVVVGTVLVAAAESARQSSRTSRCPCLLSSGTDESKGERASHDAAHSSILHNTTCDTISPDPYARLCTVDAKVGR